MEFERYDNGVPSWIDMGSPDLDKSRAFYSALFGWECPEGPPEAGGYSVCLLNGKTVAGLGPKMNPDVPTVWLTYVNVDSADETVAKVSSNGGAVLLAPMDVLDVGRMALVADPVGAVLGLWQPRTHPGAQLANEPGAFCWNELITTDSTRRRPSTRRSSHGTPPTRALRASRRPTRSGSSASAPSGA